jgi:hypothetical protein
MFKINLLLAGVLLSMSAAVLAQMPATPYDPAARKAGDSATGGFTIDEAGVKRQSMAIGQAKAVDEKGVKRESALMGVDSNVGSSDQQRQPHDMSKSVIQNIKAKEKAPSDKKEGRDEATAASTKTLDR